MQIRTMILYKKGPNNPSINSGEYYWKIRTKEYVLEYEIIKELQNEI